VIIMHPLSAIFTDAYNTNLGYKKTTKNIHNQKQTYFCTAYTRMAASL